MGVDVLLYVDGDNVWVVGHNKPNSSLLNAYNPDIVSGFQKSLENNSFSGFQNFTNLIENDDESCKTSFWTPLCCVNA